MATKLHTSRAKRIRWNNMAFFSIPCGNDRLEPVQHTTVGLNRGVHGHRYRNMPNSGGLVKAIAPREMEKKTNKFGLRIIDGMRGIYRVRGEGEKAEVLPLAALRDFRARNATPQAATQLLIGLLILVVLILVLRRRRFGRSRRWGSRRGRFGSRRRCRTGFGCCATRTRRWRRRRTSRDRHFRTSDGFMAS